MTVTPLISTAHHSADRPDQPPVPITSPPGARVPWQQQFRRIQIVQTLEAIQDLIAVSLCLGLFCVMALQLKTIFSSLLSTP